ncbi:hypothetical protein KJ940_10475 [Myxococcota bacterium]|nr:hypothetical protein [Myxococcota bacterium]
MAAQGAAPRAIKVLNAHPTQGRFDGQAAPGAIAAFDFIGPDGAQLAVGGNDHRVHVWSIEDKREVYTSKPLKTPVMHISGSPKGRFVAQTTNGQIHAFSPRGGKGAFKPIKPIEHDGAGWAWITASGRWIVAAGGRDFVIYDARTGRWRGLFGAKRLPHARAARLTGAEILHLSPEGDGLMGGVIDTMQEGPEIGARLSVPIKDEDKGSIVQAWRYGPRGWLTERCTEQRCLVTLYNEGGQVEVELPFDVAESAWSAHIPSRLAASSDGAWIFFYRPRLKAELVRIRDQKRYLLGELQRTDDADPMGAFAPTNPKRLAVSMLPKPHQITIYQLDD